MAIVDRYKKMIDTVGYEFKIKVLKDGLFRVALPEFLCDDDRNDDLTDETKEGLLKALNKLIHDYENAEIIKTRVIVYNFRISCTVEGPPELREDYDPKRFEGLDEVVILSPQFRTDTGMSIKVTAAVFDESKIIQGNGDIYYKYDMIHGDDQLPHGLVTASLTTWNKRKERPARSMIWTQERHDFFVQIYHAMGKLAWQLHQMQDTNRLQETIERGIKFLTEGEDDGK